MVSSLDGAVAKLNRAQEHARSLEAAFREFRHADSHRVEVQSHDAQIEEEAQPSGCIVRVVTSDMVSVILRVDGDKPLLRWGIIIGDIIHNLRCALDYLVYALSETFTKPMPSHANAKLKADWNHVGFPVIRDETDWQQYGGTGKLWAIDPRLMTRFEELQPWYARKHFREDPARQPLTVLHKLWNGDKHRTISLVDATVSVDAIKIDPDFVDPQTPQPVVKLLDGGISRPFQDKTELCRFEMTNPARDYQLTGFDMHVALTATIEVAFEQGPPAYGAKAGVLIPALINTVAKIIGDFESEFR